MKSELYSKMQPFLGDEQRLMQRMAGRLDLWEECVRLFPGKEIIDEMDGAMEKGDMAAFYKVVHRLKGNLANFGFDGAAETAMAVLQALKEQDASRTKQYYTNLREEYLQMIERIGETE